MAKQSPSNLLKFRDRKSLFPTTNVASKDKQQPKDEQPIAKKYLRETGFNQLINEMIISICQKYMEFNLARRLIYYGLFILIGSILCDQVPGLIRSFVPFRSEKDSFLNQYFVKIGWFWTLVVLMPFQCLTRKSIDNSAKWYNVSDLARILITTSIWYFSIYTFNYVELSTSKCDQLTIKSKRECLRKGWNWTGFDISGHTFLLLFANLILFEESKVINGFENFGYLLDARNQEVKKLTNQNYDHYNLYHRLLLPVRVSYISMTFLALLWDFMLIQTVLYYHNFLQKLIALIWTLACWYFCYHCLFPLKLFNLNLMSARTPTELNDLKG